MTPASANIVSVFLEAASANPECAALRQDGRSVTYRNLRAEVEQSAGWLRSKHIGAGDKVLVFVPMSIDLYRIVLALFHVGACPVFLDEWVNVGRLRECLHAVPCKGLIAGPRYLLLSWFIPELRRIPVRLRSDAAASVTGENLPAAVIEDQTALVTFTTGSTGPPKAANRTHAFLHAQLAALDPLLSGVESPCLTTLPIVVLLHLARGRTTLLSPRRFKASQPETIRELSKVVSEERPRSMIASPAIVDRLISTLDSEGRLALVHMKTVLTGGGPVYPDLARRMLNTFLRASVTAVYGSTEAEPISHISAKDLAETEVETMLETGLPVGEIDAAAQVGILDATLQHARVSISGTADFERLLKPAGEPGEIIVSGPHVLKHYINNPAAEAETKILVGQTIWHRTGDYGRLDADGRLYLLGRVAEVIAWEGTSLYPAILGNLLKSKAEIDQSALLLTGGKLVLVLEKKDQHRVEAALAALSGVQVNGAVARFVEMIPRDPRHQTKVDYAALRRIV